MSMDAELKAKWVKALRSGRYKQTEAMLQDNKGYCCLGVLCCAQGIDPLEGSNEPLYLGSESRLQTTQLREFARGGLSPSDCDLLAELNDSGASFDEIADYIEKNL